VNELEAADRLRPEALPRLALFLGGRLGGSTESGSIAAQRAAWEYAADAELDELEELAADWRVLQAAARQLPLAEVNRLLRERFASDWQALTRDELDAVGAELERALRE
jgi:hypothetical protein